MPRPARSISRKTKPRVRISAGGPAAPCDSCTAYRCSLKGEMIAATLWAWRKGEEFPQCDDQELGYFGRLEAGQ